MKPDPTRPRRRFAGLGLFAVLFWAVVFAAAYGIAPLYYSNQNQYFLHGIAAAGLGDLKADWLVNTRDPTPLFSTAVTWIYIHCGEWGFVAAYAVLLGIYFVSLVALIDATIGLPRSRPARFVLLTLLVAVHAGAARMASLCITGTAVPMFLHRAMTAIDVPRFLQFGVAGQYLLGPGLQPSVVGVFLVASLAAFARGWSLFAVVFAAAACAVHAAYLLPAALITLAYVFVLVRDGRLWAALLVGTATLVAVLPVLAFVHSEFGPTTPEQYAEAQRLLAEVRIPHHAVVGNWFDQMAKFQVGWVVVGILFSWRTRLFPLMAIPAIGSVLLTLIQLAPGNPAVMDWLHAQGISNEGLEQLTVGSRMLALVFPWRISVVLVPVATAVILTRIVTVLTPYPGRPAFWGWAARAVAFVLLATIVVGGVWVILREPQLLYRIDPAEQPLLDFVRDHRQPGDVYLVPVSTPTSGTAGPWELQRFRLLTGAAIYVDVKSIPYKDTEVLEWNRRVEQVKHWYAANDWDGIHDELVKAGVTNVVIPTAAAPTNPTTLEREFGDGEYSLYRVRRGP
jgi:hypothetical protein